jgi:DNA primase
MQDSVKYLIHADITADGVVERSDVVGAVFGQTEGLLGEELDLRDLQESSKIGRIDVQIDSEQGQSFGHITVGSRLDRVETAILAAALETIERVGPCRSTVEVTELEDVRSAKRRAVVERAKQLLADFEEASLDSHDIVEEVRESLRVEDITEYEGLPAGPRVADSDAIIVVEGRADVLTLLRYGVKNAVAVEGTDVPDAIADLSQERTVTAFLDGDRGGDLILKELSQVGDVDYVAFAPQGQSVEDLSRGEAMAALREKVPYEVVADTSTPSETVAATDGSVHPAPPGTAQDDGPDGPETPPTAGETETGAEPDTDPSASTNEAASAEETAGETATEDAANGDHATGGAGETSDPEPATLSDHVDEVIGSASGLARCLDDEFDVQSEVDASEAFDHLTGTEPVPSTVVVDGELDQRLLDVAAQRGVGQIVANSEGEFVKKPTGVRIRTAQHV